MPCYRPLRAWRKNERTVNGKRGITFKRSEGLVDEEFQLPCGRCIGCRLEYARQWAMRCMHEASLHEENSFITLTYDDANVPYGYSLDKRHFQSFMKRLRARIEPKQVRFFACGEYGDESFRPHYHACIFGHRPEDLKAIRRTGSDYPLFQSSFLSDVWGKGHVSVGEVSYESAGYVARYITKKVTGEKKAEAYWRVDEQDGKIYQVSPEFALMSRRPGVGRDWIDKFGLEVWNHDSVIVNGQEVLPPKFYLNQQSEQTQERIKEARKERIAEIPLEERTERRLRVKEQVKAAQTRSLKRQLQ